MMSRALVSIPLMKGLLMLVMIMVLVMLVMLFMLMIIMMVTMSSILPDNSPPDTKVGNIRIKQVNIVIIITN